MMFTEWKHYPNLEDPYSIRFKVFIDEQKVPKEEEIDEMDQQADHIVVYEENLPVATGRLILEEGKHLLGRIAVLKEHRGKKYGDLVVRMLRRKAFEKGAEEVWVHAQLQAQKFYEKLNFIPVGDCFMEAGIPHIKMVCREERTGCCPQ